MKDIPVEKVIEFTNAINLQLDAILVNNKQRTALGKIIDGLMSKHFDIDYEYNAEDK